MSRPGSPSRPPAYEDGHFLWNLQRVPRTLPDGTTPHPGRTHAIFVVHGIGEQAAAATAATLRSGFEDALEKIHAWQAESRCGQPGSGPRLPSPFVYEGYWGDYPDVAGTFPGDWQRFGPREREFFGALWRYRTLSALRTGGWYLKQQLRLLSWRVFVSSPLAWFMYLPLQILFPLTLLVGLVRYPKLVVGYLGDVRLYLDPRGDVERAIVQGIDRRVGDRFLELLGLDWDFRPLPADRRLRAGGEEVTFGRIVWVAHSLGTVISFNVLAALFRKAALLEGGGDDEQRRGVARFRSALRRFVTIGSPLDKVAFLFGPPALIAWPDGPRRKLLDGGETVEPGAGPETQEWWVNFYHVLDPISGALGSRLVCGDRPPFNYHTWSWPSWLAGYSHIAYWRDLKFLKYVLGRTYGRDYLENDEYPRPLSPGLLTAIGFLVWGTLLFGAVGALYGWWPQFWQWLLRQVAGVAGG